MRIKATVVDYPQGSEAWKRHRAQSLNASELAIAMGLSKYKTRDQLIAEKATGVEPEVTPDTQRRFDKGHAAEAIARPWGEEIVGDILYPAVLAAEVEGLPLSASLDGQDLMPDNTWEHKLLSATLAASLDAGVIPEEYHPQMEQGLMLSGASRCLFMASNGDRETMRHAWYESNPELRAKIIPTWKQFMADVAAYQAPVAAEVVMPTPTESLPAVAVRMEGSIAVISNLDLFGAKLRAFVEKLDKNPSTDQAFADAEAAIKTLQTAQDALEQAEANALAQTASIEEMRRSVADYAGLARSTRLMLEKIVKARKEQIKVEIVQEAKDAFQGHIASLNLRLGKPYMPPIATDFAGVIKGKKTVASLRDAANTELARAKIEANTVADRLQINLGTLRELAGSHAFLFADTAQIIQKQPEDLTALVKLRIADHEAAEAKRLQAERERIRAEEAARLEREAAATKAREEAEAKAKADDEARAAAQEESKRIQRENDHAAALRTSLVEQQASAPAATPATARVAEELAHVSAPAAAPAPEVRAFTRAAPANELPTMTLGQISARLGFDVRADFLAGLGFEAHKEKASRLYRPSLFPAICEAISAHVLLLGSEAKKAA